MKTKLQTDHEIFTAAIEYAKKNGYTVPPLEYAVLVRGGREMGMSSSMRMWAIGLIYSPEFLKAFFGENLVPREEDGESMYLISLWAKQIAVEYQNRLYAVDSDKYKEYVFPVHRDVAYWTNEAPDKVIEAEKVVIGLQDMAASIPVKTHPIDKVRVDNVTPEIPAWKHALRQMTEYDNPFTYLEKYLNYQDKWKKKRGIK